MSSAPAAQKGDAQVDSRPFFVDLDPPVGSFRDDAVAGLSMPQPMLSPKYFYDAEGSALFEAITRLPEYYPTRTELSILAAQRDEIRRAAGPGAAVVEIGSGSDVKIRKLLDALETPTSYVAIDISRAAVSEATKSLASDFPDITVGGVCADFTKPIPDEALAPLGDDKRLAFFPGSTIGNFEPEAADAVMRTARILAGDAGALLLGVDLRKDPAFIVPAYDDAQGVTARFNLNVLKRLKNELGAELELDAFAHAAIWVAAKSRLEMRLVAQRPTKIVLDGRTFSFETGDHIHTESSRKFERADVEQLGAKAGFKIQSFWTDPDRRFALCWFDAA